MWVKNKACQDFVIVFQAEGDTLSILNLFVIDILWFIHENIFNILPSEIQLHTRPITLWQRSRSLLEVKGDLYLVSSITSQIIATYSWYLVNIIICRCVPEEDSWLYVKVTESRRLIKCFYIWARYVATGHLFFIYISSNNTGFYFVLKLHKMFEYHFTSFHTKLYNSDLYFAKIIPLLDLQNVRKMSQNSHFLYYLCNQWKYCLET